MDNISRDSLVLIFLECPLFTIGRVSQVCTKWHTLLIEEEQNEIFWEAYHMKYIGQTLAKSKKWRDSFQTGLKVLIKAKTSFPSAVRSAVGLGMNKLLNTLLQQNEIEFSNPAVARDYGYPLHLATGKGDEATIMVLLRHQCDPSLPNQRGKTSKQIAAANSNVGALLLVAPESALTDPELFLTAVKNYRTEICFELIKIGVDVNYRGANGDMAIHAAARNGLRSLIAEFLKKGTPVDVQNDCGMTALQIASHYGKSSVVQLLLKKGADPNYRLRNSKLNSFLYSCKGYPNKETLELLLERTREGVDSFDKAHRTAIHNLATKISSENTRLIELLVVKYGARVDIPDVRGKTPLQICISQPEKPSSSHKMEMMETLCRLGSNLAEGLVDAIKSNNLNFVKLLVQKGSSVNTPDSHGIPPLFIALEKGFKSIVVYLLESGSDLYYVTPNGCSALNYLARSHRYYSTEICDYIPLAKQIIQKLGVELTLDGPHHVLDDAINSKQYDIAYFLIQSGAKMHNKELLLEISDIQLVAELLHRKLCPLPDDHLFAVYDFFSIGPCPELAMLLWYLGANPGHRSERYNNRTIFELFETENEGYGRQELMLALEKASLDPKYPFLLLKEKNLILPE